MKDVLTWERHSGPGPRFQRDLPRRFLHSSTYFACSFLLIPQLSPPPRIVALIDVHLISLTTQRDPRRLCTKPIAPPASQIMQATAWISGRAVVELDPTREAAPNTAMHGGVCLCCYVHWCTVGPLLPQGTWRSPSWESVSVVLMPTRSLNTRSFAFNCSFKVCVCVDSQRRESGTGAFTKTLWKTWPTCCVACNWPLRGPSLMLNAATPPLPSPLHRCSFIKPLW